MVQVDAVIENLRASFSNVSWACGEKVRDFPGVTACRHPTPTDEFNMAFVSDKRGLEPNTLKELQDFFRKVDATWCLVVPPGLTHLFGDVAAQLRISQRRALPEMIMRKRDRVKTPPLPEGLSITRVRTVRDLKVWSRTAHKGFGMGRRDAFAPAMNARGLSILGDMSHVGWVSGRPVATSTCYITGNMAGIYAISTLPKERGHGYGEALTWAAVEDGFSNGCNIVSLQASPMGFPMYYRMGFRRVFDIEEWVVSSKASRARRV